MLSNKSEPNSNVQVPLQERSESPPSSKNEQLPIYNIDSDILWKIFFLNTDIEEYSERQFPALVTLRRSSQVCSFWREIALKSSSLWGRVINLAALCQENNKWSNEVLKRTDRAPLYVKGRYGRNLQMEGLLKTLLTNYWTRIHSLDLELFAGFGSGNAYDSGWHVLGLPAPQLVSFKVRLYSEPIYNYTKPFSNPDFVLFSNYAPALRVFYDFWRPIDWRASWITGLREICLNSPLPLKKLLQLLACMTRLQVFEATLRASPHSDRRRTLLKQADIESEQESFPPLTLPFLEKISIVSNTTEGSIHWINFLDHITPAAGCCLNVNLHQVDFVKLLPHIKTLSRYFQLNFNFPRPNHCGTDISLELSIYQFKLSDETILHSRSHLRFRESFRLITSSGEHFIDTLTASQLLKSFSVCNLDNVTNLDLRILMTCGLTQSSPELVSLISKLSSVTLLSTTPQGLRIIRNRMTTSGPGVFFPSLTTLSLVDLNKLDRSTLTALITRRKEIGHPIMTLDLTVAVRDGLEKYNFRFLDDMDGLEVVWATWEGKKSYVCGSGKPGELDFDRVFQDSISFFDDRDDDI